MGLGVEKDTILVIDDSYEIRELLLDILDEAGFAVQTAENGEKALEVLDEMTVEIMPVLILLDIMMPGMDGYEVCRKLKAEVKLRDIPVIFLTGLKKEDDIVKGFATGGVDYITKPFYIHELIARVKTHIELFRARNEIRMLRGILPICPNCKKVRDDKGYWESVEMYIEAHSSTTFSHSLCPDCKKSYYRHYVY